MALPHFTNIRSHDQLWEPVYKNLFEVEFTLPTVLQDIHTSTSVLMENCKTANLPTYPALGVINQLYKYSTRLFVGFPSSTSIDSLSFAFNINVKDGKQMTTFRMMKDWYDLAWNNEDGSSNYKKTMVGSIVVYQHDREGEITRRVTYHNAQILSFTAGEDLTWGAGGEGAELTTAFAVDYWEDYYF